MYHNISKVVIAVLTVSLLISVAIAQDTTSSYEALDDCFISMPEGADYDCGYVTVPEFHDGRNENTISLGVIRLRSSSDTPEAPIFFGAGGPGGSVMRWAPATASEVLADPSTSYGQILETRDLIYFTQRGTQFADPFLSCPEEEAAQAELAQPGTFDEHLRIQIDALTACHDRLVAEGVNFDAYNSLENAADINAIREVFGYETIVYYGESYGTILGQHVMRDFPDILESVILDGTASLSMTDWEEDSARKYQITLERVIALCEGSPDCNENFPNFADNINAAFEQALNDPLTVELFVGGELLDVPVTAEVLSSTIYTNLYAETSIPSFPLVFQQLAAGDATTFQQFFFLANGAFSGTSTLMHAAIVCAEDPVMTEDPILPDGDVYGIAVEHAAEGVASYLALCDLVNVAPIEETDENVSSDIPVLILSGALDPATPNFRSEEVAETLPNSFTFLFPYGTHVQLTPISNCAVDIMAQFIADSATEPDGSCIDDLPPIEFARPAPTVDDLVGRTFNLQYTAVDDENIEADTLSGEYSISFTSEDELTIVADCNTLLGSYTADNEGNMTIDLGVSTLVACPEGSFSEAFIALVGDATLWNADWRDTLVLNLFTSDLTGILFEAPLDE